MKIIVLLCSIFLLTLNGWTQTDTLTLAPADSAWKLSFNGGLNFSQASFSDNWTGGGTNSIALGALLNTTASYEKGKWSYDNILELLYGVVKNQNLKNARKTQDRIFIDSKLGYDFSKNWDIYLSLNFLTQFGKGYRYDDDDNRFLISKFMAPGFLTASLGFEYKPNDYFWLRLSPFSPRITYVRDTRLYLNEAGVPPKNYGVEIGETVRYEWYALQVLTSLDKQLTENLNLQTRYQLFANYEDFSFDSIDHRLDVAISAQVTKYINVNLTAIFLYDNNQDDQIQLSQGLGIGLVYQVQNFKEE